jgi:hypothetical protein
MNRIIIAGIALLPLGAVLAFAQGPFADTGSGRFTFREVADGILRLDTDSGRVSLCSRRSAGWTCNAVPETAAALESEIGRLQDENASLKRELLANGRSLPDGAPGGSRPPRPDARGPDLPSDADIDRVMTFLDKLWHRLMDMVQSMQRQRASNADVDRDHERARGIAWRIPSGAGSAPTTASRSGN